MCATLQLSAGTIGLLACQNAVASLAVTTRQPILHGLHGKSYREYAQALAWIARQCGSAHPYSVSKFGPASS